jgi:hypothetical protein
MFLFDSSGKPFVPTNNTYSLDHGTEYKICIVNHDPKLKASASVMVDGKSVGKFRINENNKITIDRPIHTARKLTFYSVDSKEGDMANLSTDNIHLGDIVINVRMEKPRQREVSFTESFDTVYGYDGVDGGAYHRSVKFKNCGGSGLVSNCTGGTGLGGRSNQRFVDAPDIDLQSDPIIIKAKIVLANRPAVVPL